MSLLLLQDGQFNGQSPHSQSWYEIEASDQLQIPVTLSLGKEQPVPTGQYVRWAPEPVWIWINP
jgi:hypothetical protein